MCGSGSIIMYIIIHILKSIIIIIINFIILVLVILVIILWLALPLFKAVICALGPFGEGVGLVV